jgi:hypothetical protein
VCCSVCWRCWRGCADCYSYAGSAARAGGDECDAPCATLYAGGCGGGELCLPQVLELLEVLEVLKMLEVLKVLEALDVPGVMRFVLLGMLEALEGGLDFEFLEWRRHSWRRHLVWRVGSVARGVGGAGNAGGAGWLAIILG